MIEGVQLFSGVNISSDPAIDGTGSPIDEQSRRSPTSILRNVQVLIFMISLLPNNPWLCKIVFMYYNSFYVCCQAALRCCACRGITIIKLLFTIIILA